MLNYVTIYLKPTSTTTKQTTAKNSVAQSTQIELALISAQKEAVRVGMHK